MRKIALSLTFFFMVVLLSCSGAKKEWVYTSVVEGKTVRVPALTGGKIQRLWVDTGDAVEVGDTLAQIDTLELTFQRREILGGLQEIRAQEALLVTTLAQARDERDFARKTYRRFQKLLTSQSVSQQQVDEVKNRYQKAEAAYQRAVRQKQTLMAKKEQLNARLQLVEKKIRDATVLSPVQGVVSTKFFEVGEAVPPLNPVFEIIHLQEVWVKIYVEEEQLPRLRIGQPATVRIDGSKRRLTGTVRWISPKAEFTPKTILTPETRTSLVYAVKITIPNPDQILKQGMPVEVVLTVSGEQKVTTTTLN